MYLGSEVGVGNLNTKKRGDPKNLHMQIKQNYGIFGRELEINQILAYNTVFMGLGGPGPYFSGGPLLKNVYCQRQIFSQFLPPKAIVSTFFTA